MKKILTYTLVFLALAVGVVCAWAPWLGDDDARGALRAIRETGVTFDGNGVADDGEILCDGVSVRWVIFGRQVNDCSSTWLVTFWGGVYDGAVIWRD